MEWGMNAEIGDLMLMLIMKLITVLMMMIAMTIVVLGCHHWAIMMAGIGASFISVETGYALVMSVNMPVD